MDDPDFQDLKDRVDGHGRRLQRVEYSMWGLRGDNGLISEVRGLRADLQRHREEESNRRNEASDDRSKQSRVLVIALLAALVTLIVGIVNVAVVLA